MLVFIAMVVLQAISSQLIAKPWENFSNETKEHFNSALARKIYTNRSDELGQLQLAFKFMVSQKETVLYRRLPES